MAAGLTLGKAAPGVGHALEPLIPFGLFLAAEVAPRPKRFHGSLDLHPMRLGLDASGIGQELIAHLVGLPGLRFPGAPAPSPGARGQEALP